MPDFRIGGREMVKIDAVNAFCMFLSRLGITGFLGFIHGHWWDT